METNANPVKLDAKSFKSDQYVRWCPGCGDHGVLATLQKSMAEVGISTEQTAVISGIGCSSRLPYYVNAYGFHTIHGRAAAIATVLRPLAPISVYGSLRGTVTASLSVVTTSFTLSVVM